MNLKLYKMKKLCFDAFEKAKINTSSKVKGGSLAQLVQSAWNATPPGGSTTWSDSNGDGVWTNGTGGFVDLNTGQWWSGPIY